jgi:hypothetical protein
MPAPDVVFHFDPICPWTWMTSRWLTEVTDATGLALGFRPLSLRVVNDVEPGRYDALDAAFEALRVIAALDEAGDRAAAARFYTGLGELVHRRGQAIDRLVVAEALVGAALPESIAGTVADPAWDGAVVAATRAAVDAAGGGIGSPVILWPATGRATSGPIVSPPPTGTDALRLWDAVTAALDVPGFYELKRGREGVKPQIP